MPAWECSPPRLDSIQLSMASPGSPASDFLAVLDRLVDRSLVTTDESSLMPAFRLLAPIGEFARRVLHASGEEAAIRQRHATYHLEMLRRLEDVLESPDDLAAVATIESSEPDLRATLEWALDDGRTAIGLEVAGRLGRYWWLRGRVREGVEWLERVLSSDAARDPRVDGGTLAKAMYWAGVLLDDARRPDEARDRLESALRLQRELGDERATARTLNSLGVVARSQGDLARAEELFVESLERKRRLGDQAGIAVTLSNLGVVANDRRDFERAADLLAQALAVDEATGSASAMAVSCANLGSVLIRAGRAAEGSTKISTERFPGSPNCATPNWSPAC